MYLTWKDAAATLLVGSTGVITYAKAKGFNWPLLGSWRMGTLALLILGLGTCIMVGSGSVPIKSVWTGVATVLGVIAFIFATAGLILDSKLMFFALAADIVALWVLTTIRHLIISGG